MVDSPPILDAHKIVETAERLRRRIEERFPDASLASVAGDVQSVAERSAELSERLARPLYWVRLAVFVLILALPVAIVWGLLMLSLPSHEFADLADFLSVFLSAIETMVFLGAGIAFLITIELRIKRSRVNSAVHELRALAHLVDSHQLSKDPIFLMKDTPTTRSSPIRDLDAFMLGRYLDYCSELLSLIGKIAALYGQNIQDSTALDSIDRVETLTTGLSRKIWQKLSMLRNL